MIRSGCRNAFAAAGDPLRGGTWALALPTSSAPQANPIRNNGLLVHILRHDPCSHHIVKNGERM